MSYLDSYPLHKTMRIIFYRDDIQRRIHTAQLSISLFLKVHSGINSKCVSSLCYAVTHDINLVDSTTLPRPLSVKLINMHNMPEMPTLVATLATHFCCLSFGSRSMKVPRTFKYSPDSNPGHLIQRRVSSIPDNGNYWHYWEQYEAAETLPLICFTKKVNHDN